MEGYENHKWFEITDEAKHQMEKLLTKNPDKYAVSLQVNGGGCAGFKYEWGFVDAKENVAEGDHTEDWHTGRFVVDEASMILSGDDPVESKIIKLNDIAERSVDISGIGMYALGKHKKSMSEDELDQLLGLD